MSAIRRPVRPSDLLLPLRGSENFSWKSFETFAEQFVAAMTGPRTVHYGKHGEKQFGIDSYVDLDDGSRWTFQFRQVEDFSEAAAKATVKETTYDGQRHFAVVACEVGTAVRDFFDTLDDWEIWDVRDVSQCVRMLPADQGRQLVYQCFGEDWVRNFYQSSSVVSFLTPEMFFDARPGDLLRHDVPLVGRESQIDELEQFINSDARIALIDGRGGLGKSRLLSELPRLRGGFEVRFAARNLQLTAEAVRDLPLEPTIVVIDDVHERDDWPVALEIARQRPIRTKVVLALRPYALERVRSSIAASGFGSDEVRLITRLRELDREQTRQLIRKILGQDNEALVSLLMGRSSDAPVVAVVGARLLRAKQIDLGRLSSNDDIRHVIFDRLIGEHFNNASFRDPALVRRLLDVVSALAPVSIDDAAIRAQISSFLKIETDELVRVVDEVMQAGVLRQRGSRVRITPEVMSDYVLERACFTSAGKATGFATRVFRHFSTHDRKRLLRNLGEADWRVGENAPESILDEVWAELREEFSAGTITERAEILESVAGVAAFQPERALAFCELALTDPVGSVSEIEAAFNLDAKDALRPLPTILKNVSYNYQYLSRSVRLLWELGRDDAGPLNSNFNHPFRVLTELAAPHPRKPPLFQEKIVETVVALLKEADAHSYAHSLIDVLAAALARQGFHTAMEDAGTFSAGAFVVNRDAFANVHDRVLVVLRELSEHDRVDVVVKAVTTLADYTKPLFSGTFGQEITAEQQEAWREPRLTTLAFLWNVARESAEPLVALEILHAVEFAAFHDSDPTVRRAAREVVDAVLSRADTEDTILAVDGWGNRYQLHDGENVAEAHKRKHEEFRSRLEAGADRLIRTQEPRNLLDHLEGRLSVAIQCGLSVSPEHLLFQIASRNPEYTARLLDQVSEVPNHPLAQWTGRFLVGLSRIDRSAAFRKADQLSRHPDAQLRACTADLLSLDEHELPSDSASLFERLVGDSEVSVRRAAIRNIWWAAKTNTPVLWRVLSTIDLDGDEHFGKELAGLFGATRVPVSEVPFEVLERLVDQFAQLPSLDDYHVSDFLANAMLVVPLRVVKTFLLRVEAREEAIIDRAVPFNFHVDVTKLCATNEYGDVIRVVRDAMLPESGWKSHYIPRLFNGIAHIGHPVTREVLGEWFRSGDEEKVAAAAALLSDLPNDFVFVHRDWVVEVLEAAAAQSSDCFRSVQTSFLNSATGDVRTGSHGAPFPQDVWLLQEAEKALTDLEPLSPAWKFYSALARHAKAEVERKRISDEDQEEEFLD